MTKKDYMKPTMKVVQLKQRQHILVGSIPEALDGPKTLNGHEKTGSETQDIWYYME